MVCGKKDIGRVVSVIQTRDPWLRLADLAVLEQDLNGLALRGIDQEDARGVAFPDDRACSERVAGQGVEFDTHSGGDLRRAKDSRG